MVKYKIETFNDFVKILKIQIIKNKMLDNVSVDYGDLYNIVKSRDILQILKLMKKLNISLFIEE